MAGRSATFYLGGQPNAQASVETGLVFNPSSLAVDNSGPQTITVDNPPVVIPPYTVGRVIPITLQSNRIKAKATGLSSNGNPAALTWYEDAQPPASGVTTQQAFSTNFVQGFLFETASFSANSYSLTLSNLTPGAYACIGATLQLVNPIQNATGIIADPLVGNSFMTLSVNAVYQPFAAIFPPVPAQIVVPANGQLQVLFLKSDATTTVQMLYILWMYPIG